MNAIFSFGCDGTTFEDKSSGTLSISVMTSVVDMGVCLVQNIEHNGSLLKTEEGTPISSLSGEFKSGNVSWNADAVLCKLSTLLL